MQLFSFQLISRGSNMEPHKFWAHDLTDAIKALGIQNAKVEKIADFWRVQTGETVYFVEVDNGKSKPVAINQI